VGGVLRFNSIVGGGGALSGSTEGRFSGLWGQEGSMVGVVGATLALLAGAADILGVLATMAIVTSRARGVLSKALGRPAVPMVGEEATVGLADDLPVASASRLARSFFS